MSAIFDTVTPHAPLAQWLRLLWDRAPPLRFDSESPCISNGAIHLPACDQWRRHAAAAAHATAHLVYSPASFDGAGLGPLVRALAGLLEDARVEALAMRELPGLARLWRPLHTATPTLGSDVESLMRRLSRALVDPGYVDSDPWVAKGRQLFFVDAELGLSALRTPAEVRRAAMLLGNDIGQQRLQFNARGYTPAPAYRDDHRWMWPVEVAVMPPPAAGSVADESIESAELAFDESFYPEWDRLIARVRPAWTRVIETPVAVPPGAVPDDAELRRTTRRLRGSLRRLREVASAVRRVDDGELFEPSALVEWRVARQLRQPPDGRVYRAPAARRVRAGVWLLVDQSASSALAHDDAGNGQLRVAVRAASAIAAALQELGVACAIVGFSSNGRHAVHLRRAKAFGERADHSMQARLRSLQPGGSTRLGAALRHAAARLAANGTARPWVIVLSDADVHDVDIHDPAYLVDDARHAVRIAAGRGVRMAALVLGRDGTAQARRIFGPRGALALGGLRALPRLLQALLR